MAGQRDFQQGSHCHRKTWINILLGILQLLLSCLQHGGAQLPGLTRSNFVFQIDLLRKCRRELKAWNLTCTSRAAKTGKLLCFHNSTYVEFKVMDLKSIVITILSQVWWYDLLGTSVEAMINVALISGWPFLLSFLCYIHSIFQGIRVSERSILTVVVEKCHCLSQQQNCKHGKSAEVLGMSLV